MTPDPEVIARAAREQAMPDDSAPRLTGSPADLFQMLMDGDMRQIGDALNLAPPEDEAMPPHEWAVRRKMLELTDIPQHHHQANAMLWERISELAMEAANAEWRLLQAESTARAANAIREEEFDPTATGGRAEGGA